MGGVGEQSLDEFLYSTALKQLLLMKQAGEKLSEETSDEKVIEGKSLEMIAEQIAGRVQEVAKEERNSESQGRREHEETAQGC